MKTIIAGSRDITDYSLLLVAIQESKFDITEVISGTANGVDKLGERFAKENDIKLTTFPANWAFHGKRAGMVRNKDMAEYADAAIILYDGKSSGARNMIKLSKDYNLELFLKIYTFI